MPKHRFADTDFMNWMMCDCNKITSTKERQSYFKRFHTKHLLKFLLTAQIGGWEGLHKILKEELAERSHIPNKIEARKIRQEKAKRR